MWNYNKDIPSFRRGGAGVERGVGPCAQYISNKRPSRFVILSGAKDDTPASASFDSQHVLFEMYWALCPPTMLSLAIIEKSYALADGESLVACTSVLASRSAHRRCICSKRLW